MGLSRRLLKFYLTFIFSYPAFQILSQTEIHKLRSDSTPVELASYFKSDSLIDIDHLRKVSNFLTNPYILEENGKPLPKRKKAFVHYVKEINEKLELAYLSNKKLNEEMMDLLYQLEWIRLSFLQKSESNSSLKMSFHDKKEMLLNTLKSKHLLAIRIPAQNVRSENANISSPFYTDLTGNIAPEERFDQLAKIKKIHPQNQMVVLADQFTKGGSAPKFEVRDVDLENKWVIKWGDEVHTDIFCSRMFASLGYDVDHPYYYSENLILVFDEIGCVKTPKELIDSIRIKFGVSMDSFIKCGGIITKEMAEAQSTLSPFIGKQYLKFTECSLEARPDRVKRLGSFMPYAMNNISRQELRGSLLAHIYIDNWDTREDNTALTLVNRGNKRYSPSAIFSDLGTSMGVHISWLHQDFKVGLVNELSWEAMKKRRRKIHFTSSFNAMVDFYEHTDFSDVYWMGLKIAAIDSIGLRKMIEAAHWPSAIGELYFHKMASRRASILSSLNIPDTHPIIFSKTLCIKENGRWLVKQGKFCKKADLANYPISYIDFKGRMRNYGNK
jgi:hypothetical protein